MSTARIETRRVPTQQRSRQRVSDILDSAADLVVGRGVDALTTRDIAEAAGVPVASLYQYFADKDAVLLALAGRDMAEMDAEVAAAVGELATRAASCGELTIELLVRTVMESFVEVYHRRRAFVEIYLRGRSNAAVHRFGRAHNEQVASGLRAYALEAGLVRPELTDRLALLAVEIGDRVFQLAFEQDAEGDPLLIEEGMALVTCYLQRWARR